MSGSVLHPTQQARNLDAVSPYSHQPHQAWLVSPPKYLSGLPISLPFHHPVSQFNNWVSGLEGHPRSQRSSQALQSTLQHNQWVFEKANLIIRYPWMAFHCFWDNDQNPEWVLPRLVCCSCASQFGAGPPQLSTLAFMLPPLRACKPGSPTPPPFPPAPPILLNKLLCFSWNLLKENFADLSQAQGLLL